MTRTAGSRIGHYEIVALLGAGGMGEVYRARDTRLGRDVAIKIVGATSADQSAQARLIREAQRASILNHPHICTIHEVGETADGAFFVMEYVNGQTLGALIPPDGLPVEVVVRYGGQIADALAHAHDHGVVHRDLKSANVMITSEGRTKVLDFGVARRLSSHDAHDITQSRDTLAADGVIAGTLAYMAPEILQGKPADQRSDIWAFGVLLQEMAAGERPFKGQTGFDLTSAILRDSPATLPQRVPATIRRIVQKCLAKDPQQRYQRASEVHAALEMSHPERSNDLRVSVEPVQAQRSPMKTGRPRHSLAWILAVSLTCLALGIGSWVAGRGLGFWSASLDPRTVLILPLEVRGQNDGGDYVGRAFAEALAMHLARTEGLHVLPVPDVGELGAGGSLSRVAAARDAGAGRLLMGALTRSEGALQVSLSLTDTTGNRVTWGAQKEGSAEMLSTFAALLAQEFAAHVGATSTRRYDYFMYDTGSPGFAASPEMTAALSHVRRLNGSDLASTKRLVETFPNEPAARVLRALSLFGDWIQRPLKVPGIRGQPGAHRPHRSPKSLG